MLADFDTTPGPLRKAMSVREAMSKHQACGGFLHYLKILEGMAPAAEFQQMSEELHRQFQYGYLDPDILHSLESSVPPGDISMVSAFRTECVSEGLALRSFPRSKTNNVSCVGACLWDT